eukprot:CAMPEP_0114237434 /NCGR_PEP_ID=MMETSP0058-20121206/7388_1 /TAXON_ID=36894 /ORGANISM="Pyramimonas parkeae, CCMP726" /LENGTH=887 /DNA_ID=CAMNT_0001349475 /DNA_START=308 /DNA_END=2971 /DNA_ORIENTATION=+
MTLDKVSMKVGDDMRLVCSKWWQSWQDHVQYLGETPLTGPVNVHAPPGPITNQTLLEPGSVGAVPHQLRANLQENEDYVIVSSAAWEKLFLWYGGGPSISRKVITLGTAEQVKVEVYPVVLDVTRSSNLAHSSTVSISCSDTVGDLLKKLCEEYGLQEDDCRLWDFYKGTKYHQLKDMQITIDEARLVPGQQIMLEEKVDGEFAPIPDDCVVDNNNHSSYTASNGTGVLRLGYTSTSLEDDVTFDLESPGRKGRAGLHNLGNTCFMNSALQCLSHTPPLTKYFLSNAHMAEINVDNPLGLGGELATAFGSLMHSLWKETAASVAPRSFKSKLGRFAPNFSGYNQQDSQELLAFLLDGLHEDLNRVKTKPYIEAKDSDGRPDDEVADEAWTYHQARNNSVIVDLFQGQYKSTLVCPVCTSRSVTFDPFMYLSLQLPSTSRHLKFVVVTSDGSAPPTTHGVKVPKTGRLTDALSLLGTQVGLREDERLLAAEVFHSYVYRWVGASTSLASVKEDDALFAFRLPRSVQGFTDLKDVVLYHRKPDKSRGGNIDAAPQTLFGAPTVVSIPASMAGGGEEGDAAVATALSVALRPFEMASKDTPMATATPGDESDVHSMEEDDAAESSNPGALFELKHCTNTCGSVGPSYKQASAGALKRPLAGPPSSLHGIPSSSTAPTSFTNLSSLPSVEYVAVDWAPHAWIRHYSLAGMDTPLSHPSSVQEEDVGIDLDQCIESFLQEEPLGPDDMWYCPKCKEHREATKKLELWRMPEVLVVHLKRFSYNRVWRDKLDLHVKYPLHGLDLSKFVQRSEGKKPEYHLFAVSNHYGGLGGGHYTAYAKQTDDGQWYLFDDSSVMLAKEEDVCSAAGYCLFYWRKDVAKGSFADLSSAAMET